MICMSHFTESAAIASHQEVLLLPSVSDLFQWVSTLRLLDGIAMIVAIDRGDVWVGFPSQHSYHPSVVLLTLLLVQRPS